MTAYVILDINVHDSEGYEEYKKLSPAAVAAYGGRFIVRGFGGTTAATHLISAAVSRWVPHPSLSEWVLAETQNAIAQEDAGWARTIGSGESERQTFARGLVDLRKQAMSALGRMARKAVI